MAGVIPADREQAAESSPRGPLLWLAAASLVLLGLRLYAARRVGFGDSEALYACYAMHPQGAYVDHPGLVGVIARAIGRGTAPTPEATHLVTALASTLLPWLFTLCARGAGATWRASLIAALALAAAPEIGVGLFGMTPDVPLAFAWIGALGLVAFGLRAPPKSTRAAASLIFAGLLVGIASAAKVSGALLALALVVTYAARPARAHARTPWPWMGLAIGALVVLPAARYDASAGFAMLHHRLVDTQVDAGVSVRNLGAVIGGQLAYVSPPLLYVAWLVARDLAGPTRRRGESDAVTRLLLASFAIPLAALFALSLWSRVAEPHWLAPAYLALVFHAARTPGLVGRGLARASIGTGFALILAVHAWVLIPSSARLLPEDADPKLDLASELVGWPQVTVAVREVLESGNPLDPDDVPIVVGPHWTICAQLHAALGPALRVGCDGPSFDDFDTWLPRNQWRKADEILFVTDARYPVDLEARYPTRIAARSWQVPIERGGRLARLFTLTLLTRRAMGRADF